LWSPKVNANGRRNRFYDSMTEAVPGDVVFSFCDTLIKAIGVVNGYAQSAPKPTEFGTTGHYWANEGWYLPVRFEKLSRPIRPKDFMDSIASTLPSKYSPLQANGNGNQVVYLAPVPDEMATVLITLLDGQVEPIIFSSLIDDDSEADAVEKSLIDDSRIPETERKQLVKARIGQGLFRSRVEMLENGCRITGVKDRKFLRASHVKPWAKSDNSEKLDGSNGLMLSPHIDHLFDKGFISFTDSGQLIFSKFLPTTIQIAWHLEELKNPHPFTTAQAMYMAYHRSFVFKG
jgi:putative restriction endonuclease